MGDFNFPYIDWDSFANTDLTVYKVIKMNCIIIHICKKQVWVNKASVEINLGNDHMIRCNLNVTIKSQVV
ncbi:hypothetical protein Avbf_09145 [Armadillidium vulgare]|nr:hypothetical protein Avbf_09145 [Armadillidium vulgare]